MIARTKRSLLTTTWLTRGAVAAAALFVGTGCGIRTLLAVNSPTATVLRPPTRVAYPYDKSLLSDIPDALKYARNGSHPISDAAFLKAKQQVGLVVCTPVVSPPGDAALQNFAAGCAYWAQVVAASRPELGGTPSNRGINRAAVELSSPMLSLSDTQARLLKQTTGVPLAAVGILSADKTSGQYDLAYRLLRTSDGEQSGPPITITGTREQIISQLPTLAERLWQQMEVAAPKDAVLAPSLDGDDMAMIGQARWGSPNLDFSSKLQALALKPGNGIAALALFYTGSLYSSQQRSTAIASAFALLPHNPDVYLEAAADYPDSMQAVMPELKADLARYPANYQYLAAFAKVARQTNLPPSIQIESARAVIAASPRMPDAWTVASQTYADVANNLRKGAFAGDIPPADGKQLAQLYPAALGCAERAVALDPQNSHAWTIVQEQATFNGNAQEADAAFRHGLQLASDLFDAYDWALQMYQDKWYGYEYPGKFKAVVNAACSDSRLPANELLQLANNFSPELQADTYSTIVNASKPGLYDLITKSPRAPWPHKWMADAANDTSDTQTAEQQYLAAATLAPDNPDILNSVANYYHDRRMSTDALGWYSKVAALQSGYPDVYTNMALCYKTMHRYPEAFSALQTQMKLTPGEELAQMAEGDIYQEQRKLPQAAASYLAATKIDPLNRIAWEDLIYCYDAGGNPQTAIKLGPTAMRQAPEDGRILVALQDANLQTHHPAATLQLCEYDLAFNDYKNNHAYSHENLAEAYLQLGLMDNARREWNMVLTYDDPDMTPVARRYLAQYPA